MTALHDWLTDLENRHLSDLTFAELSRALRALSATYVERRGKLAEGAALAGAGKRAAFALFYGPLHFLLLEHVARSLPIDPLASSAIVDIGCGTGAAGAALALATSARRVIGIDRSQWALDEAVLTYRHFGLNSSTRRGDARVLRLPGGRTTFLAAFVMNELRDDGREELLTRLLERRRRGDRVLIVEPIAGVVASWWDRWRRTVEAAGGRADEWRVRAALPEIVARLDRAAGLDHRELTARSFWLAG